MKKTLSSVGIFLLLSTSAMADPGLFFGLTYDFGGSVGISAKVLSTNKEKHGVVGAGVSYFPMTNKFGADASAGYLFEHVAVTAGWDFLQSTPQVGVGYVDTKSSQKLPAPAAAPPAPPPSAD